MLQILLAARKGVKEEEETAIALRPNTGLSVDIAKCYNLKTLELVNEKNLILELTQENSIENSIQDCLSYIPKTTSLCSTTLVYPK